MQCEEWADANSELFKEAHNEAVHKNSYKSRLYELISASLGIQSYGYYTIWFPTRHDTTGIHKCQVFLSNPYRQETVCEKFPVRLGTMLFLTYRKLFAKGFPSSLTLWYFLPTGNCLLKVSYPV